MQKEQSELLKMKYLDHTAELRFRKEFDFKLVSGFITLSLVLMGWIGTYSPVDLFGQKVPLLILVFGYSYVAWKFFERNDGRRKVVVKIIQNINSAFDFDTIDAYVKGKRINPPPNDETKWWIDFYRIVVWVFCGCLFWVIADNLMLFLLAVLIGVFIFRIGEQADSKGNAVADK